MEAAAPLGLEYHHSLMGYDYGNGPVLTKRKAEQRPHDNWLNGDNAHLREKQKTLNFYTLY